MGASIIFTNETAYILIDIVKIIPSTLGIYSKIIFGKVSLVVRFT